MRRYGFLLLVFATRLAFAASDLTAPCSGKTRIDAFAAQIDSRLKGMEVRSFAEEGLSQPFIWRELKTGKASEGTFASVYIEKRNPLAAFFTIQSESGDWVLFANYYFRPDGSLAKMHEHLNTYYGDASVIRDTYFGCHGEAYGGTTRHLDWETQKPKEPDVDFIDERAPLFNRVRSLPFFSALDHGR